MRPYTPLLALGIFLISIMGMMDGLIALAIKPALDVVLNPHSTLQTLALFTIPHTHRVIYLNSFVPHRIHHVWSVFGLALLFIFLVKGASEYFGTNLIQFVGLSGVTDLRNDVYSKIVQQPVGFFQHNPVGRVMSAVISDIEQIRSVFSDWLADFFRQIFSFIAFIAVLLLIDWRMAVGSAVLIPLVVWPVGKLGRRIRRSSEKSRSRLADLSQILEETISGNRIVKAFGMEGFEIRKFREAARNLLRENMRWIRASAATSPMMDVLGAVVISMVLLFARGEIKAGRMTIGAFGAFVFALFKAYEPVKRLGNIYQQFLQAVGISTQVFAFLDLPEEAMEAPGAKALPPFSKSIEFDRASFSYDDGPPILKNIDLKVPAGAVVAIVGSSGAGKTTLVNLLPRFHEVTTGTLRIDGFGVNDCTLRSLREQMAIVTQETILFNDTIRNNLCYGRPDMPEAQVDRRGAGGNGSRFHFADAAGLSDRRRRPRPASIRRPAATTGYRACAAEECADTDSRRSDLRTRFRVGNARSGRAQQSDDWPHRICDRAPPLDHPPGGYDCGARRWRDSRTRHARRTSGAQWNLRAPVRNSISRRRACNARRGS